jgi:hypothetical protein
MQEYPINCLSADIDINLSRYAGVCYQLFEC